MIDEQRLPALYMVWPHHVQGRLGPHPKLPDDYLLRP